MEKALAQLFLCCLVTGVIAVFVSGSWIPLLASVGAIIATVFGLLYALKLVASWLSK